MVSGSVGVGVCFALGGVVLIPFLPCQVLKMRHFPLIDYLMICIIWFNAASVWYPGVQQQRPSQQKENKVFKPFILNGNLGKPSFQKSAVFLNIVQKAFDPPPLYLNICPILQGVFFIHTTTSNVF